MVHSQIPRSKQHHWSRGRPRAGEPETVPFCRCGESYKHPPESEQGQQTLHVNLGATGPGSGLCSICPGPPRAPSPGSCPTSAGSPSQGLEAPPLCVGPARPWVSPLQTSLWKWPHGGSGFKPRPYLHFTEEAGAAPGVAAGWGCLGGCGAVAPASTWRSLSFPEDHVSTRLPWGRDPALKPRVPPWSLLGGPQVAFLPGPQPRLGGDGGRGPAHGAQTGTRDPVTGEPPLHAPGPGGLWGLGARARPPS